MGRWIKGGMDRLKKMKEKMGGWKGGRMEKWEDGKREGWKNGGI